MTLRSVSRLCLFLFNLCFLPLPVSEALLVSDWLCYLTLSLTGSNFISEAPIDSVKRFLSLLVSAHPDMLVSDWLCLSLPFSDWF